MFHFPSPASSSGYIKSTPNTQAVYAASITVDKQLKFARSQQTPSLFPIGKVGALCTTDSTGWASMNAEETYVFQLLEAKVSYHEVFFLFKLKVSYHSDCKGAS